MRDKWRDIREQPTDSVYRSWISIAGYQYACYYVGFCIKERKKICKGYYIPDLGEWRYYDDGVEHTTNAKHVLKWRYGC